MHHQVVSALSTSEFQDQMRRYIRRHFAGLLGEHLALLDREDGFEQLSSLVQAGKVGTPT